MMIPAWRNSKKSCRLTSERYFLFILLSLLLITITCINSPTSLQIPLNSSLSLKLTDSRGYSSNDSIAETIGRDIKIVLELIYPEFIKKIDITILNSAQGVDFDTTITPSSTIVFDTIRFSHALINMEAGEKNVIAAAFIKDSVFSDTVRCMVLPYGIDTPYPPVFTIAGNRHIAAGDLCSLTIDITDQNKFQTHTISLIRNLNTFPISSNPYIYRIPTNDTIDDTLTFVVTDDGTPPLSDTETVIIDVYVKIPEPPCLLHIESRDSDSITLGWEGSSRAELYTIYRSDNSPSGFTLHADSLTVTTFTENPGDTIRYYYATAINSAGESDSSNIISSEDAVNTAPQWKIADTLKIDLKQDSTFSLNLADTCVDLENDVIEFTLLPNSITTDTIEESTYYLTAPDSMTETFVIAIRARDSRGLSDTLIIAFTIIESVPPNIRFTNIETDSVVVKNSSVALGLVISDRSGISHVKCTNTATGNTYHIEKTGDSTWVCIINKLAVGKHTNIAITATDNSVSSNKTEINVYLKYEPIVNDTNGPSFQRILPDTDSASTNIDIFPITFICNDPSGIASITCSVGETKFDLINYNDSIYATKISGLVKDEFTQVLIKATDSSGNLNVSTMVIHLKYDPTITDHDGPGIILQSPPNDSSSVSVSSLTVGVLCTDPSGVASVTCSIGVKNIPVTKGASDNYLIDVNGLAEGANTLLFTATDASTNANISTKRVTVYYDPSLSDLIGPYFILQTPAKDSSKVSSSSITIELLCTDVQSKVASVNCSFGGNIFPVVKRTADMYSVDINGFVLGANTITFTATDASTHKNTTTKDFVIIYDPTIIDNVAPLVTFVTPAKDSTIVASDSTMVTLIVSDKSNVASVTCLLEDEEVPVTQGISNDYTVTVSRLSKGPNTLSFIATDASANANQIVKNITIIYDPTVNDHVLPAITLLTPQKDSSKISSSSITLEIICSDTNGIALVSSSSGSRIFPVTNETSNRYYVNVTGLAEGANTIVITATDASINANKSTRSITIIYDPTMNDNVPPVITLKNPAKNGTLVFKESITIEIEAIDDNGVASVTASRGGKPVVVSKSKGSHYFATIADLTDKQSDSITFVATDSSSNANSRAFKVFVKYRKMITAITLGEPENKSVDIEYIPKFTWTGGEDPEAKPRYYQVHYGTTSKKLNEKTSMVTTSPAKITTSNALAPYKTYYWQLVVYSKDKKEITRSEIRSFRTEGIAPTISKEPKSIEITERETLNLTVVASGAPLPTYQWYLDDKKISGATSATYTKEKVAGSDSGTYHVVVSNGVSPEKKSSDAKVSVIILTPPSIIKHPGGGTRKVGESITFQVVADGFKPLAYQWLKNDKEVEKAVSASYEIENVHPNDAGDYSVRITNISGNIESKKATLRVTIDPPEITGPEIQTVMLGDKVTFSIKVEGIEPFSYQWQKSQKDLKDETSNTYTIDETTIDDDRDKFRCIVTNYGKEFISDEVQLTLLYSVTYDKNGGSGSVPEDEKTYKRDDEVILKASELSRTGYLFEGWSTDKKGDADYPPESEYIMGKGNVTFYAIWKENKPPVIEDHLTFTPSIPNVGNEFEGTAFANDPEDMDLTWKVVSYDTKIISLKKTSGTGNEAKLSGKALKAGTTPIAVEFSDGDKATTTSVEMEVTDHKAPKIIDDLPTAVNIVLGKELVLSITASGNPAPSYTWYKDKIKLKEESATLSIKKVTEEDGGNYRVIVSNGIGDDLESNSTRVIIQTTPVITKDLPNTLVVDVGENLELGITAAGNPLPTYTWYKDEIKQKETSATFTIENTSVGDAGNYRVIVSNGVGGDAESNELTLIVTTPITPVIPVPILLE